MPTCRPRTDLGFTLMEMLVVITVIGLIAAVALPSLGERAGRFSRQRDASRMEAAIAEASRKAQLTGVPQLVDPVAVIGAKAEARPVFTSSHPGKIAVYADGSSSGDTVFLDDLPLVRVDWLTSEAEHVS